MPTRKVIAISLALFLALGFFAEGVFAEVCLCGKLCSYLSCEKSELKTNSGFDKRCSDNSCKSCNVENSRSTKGACYSKQVIRVNIFTALLISDLPCDSSINRIAKNEGFFRSIGALYSSPVYLKNLSIRC